VQGKRLLIGVQRESPINDYEYAVFMQGCKTLAELGQKPQ